MVLLPDRRPRCCTNGPFAQHRLSASDGELPDVAILVIIPIVMFLAENMCDFWCIQGIHQFLNLVMAHINSMPRICGQYNTDHQIANPARQHAPPATDSIKVRGEFKAGPGTRHPQENQAYGGALEPSNERNGADWHRTW